MAVSHVYSNTNADATGTLTIWNGATTSTVAASNLVKPSDWNSAHNQYMTISGNTLGSSTMSGTNIVLAASNDITLSAATAAGAATIWINGYGLVDKFYPQTPVPLATSSFVSGTSGGTGGSTQHTVSGYVAPMILNKPLSYHEVGMVISGQASTAGTGSASNGYMIGIYTNNASTLSLLTSYQWANVYTQSSVTAVTRSWWWGTNSTSNSSSLGGNVSATFTRIANIILNNASSTLSPGTYYIAVVHTNRTSGLNCGGNSSAMCWSLSQSTGGSYFGQASLRPPFDEKFFGAFSTTLNAANSGLHSLPSLISSSAITKTGGSSQWRIPFVRFYATNT